MLRVLLWTCFGILAATPTSLWAELTWPTPVIELTTPPGATEASGVFHFTNTGSAPLTIVEVHTSCDCTTTALTKTTYAPGETGTITAKLTIGDRLGVQEKTIVVRTDDPSAAPTTLTLRVTIPERLICSPRILIWRTTGPLHEQVATLTAVPPAKLTSLTPTAVSPDQVKIRLETVTEGTTYRLTLQPASLALPGTYPVRLTAQFADGRSQHYTLYALVK